MKLDDRQPEDFYSQRFEVEYGEKWRDWINQIPDLSFPNGWKVRIIPPFGGAMSRFQVTTDKGGRASIYLDVYCRLGFMDYPYWEVYEIDGDCQRCEMTDTKELMKLIAEALKQRELANAKPTKDSMKGEVNENRRP